MIFHPPASPPIKITEEDYESLTQLLPVIISLGPDVLDKAVGQAYNISHELYLLTYPVAAGVMWRYYSEVQLRKRGGGYRNITAPSSKLKLFQQQLLPLLQQRIPLGYVVTAKKGANYIDNAKRHTGAKHILRMDIKNFFPSVDAERVRQEVKFNHPAQAEWFDRIIPFMFIADHAFAGTSRYSSCYLPQGAPTSPFIANLAAAGLDRKILKFLEKYPGAKYTRYVDDLTISFSIDLSETERNDIKNAIQDLMISDYWQPHPKKTKWVNPNHDRVTVTGVDVRAEPKVNNQYIREKVRPMLDAAARHIAAEFNTWHYPDFTWIREPAVFQTFEDIVKIYFRSQAPTLAYIKQVNPEQYYKCLDYLKKRINKQWAVRRPNMPDKSDFARQITDCALSYEFKTGSYTYLSEEALAECPTYADCLPITLRHILSQRNKAKRR